MLTEFLYSFPIFFFALFASIQVSELGYWISTNDLMSFYAARAKFVSSGDPKIVKNAVEKINNISRHPIQSVMGRKIKETLPKINFVEENSHQIVKIKTPKFPLIQMVDMKSRYSGDSVYDAAKPLRKFQDIGFVSQTAIPEREAGEEK